MPSIIPAGELVYGMQLQVQAKSLTFAEDWEADAGSQQLAASVRKADETGFFYVAVCDHLAVTKPLDEHMRTTWYDTVATLGWIAGITHRVRILSHVYVLSYRHPLHTAKSFMTLDELSGGRAILGVGAGHLEGEFALLGLDYRRRGAVTDAAIDVIRDALAEEYPDVRTPVWGHLHDAGMAPRPRQRPLPIWVGGSSKPALRRAAERGDGWLPQGTPRRDLPGQIARLRELRAELRGGAPIDIGTIAEPIHLRSGGAGWDLPAWVNSGGAEEVAEPLRELVAMGVNHLQVRFMARSADEFAEQTARFGVEVGPLLNP